MTDSFDEIVKAIVKAQQIVEETEASIAVLKDEVADRLRAERLTGKKSGKWFVTRIKRLITTDVPLSIAEELGAVKKAIDQNALKKLVEKGIKINGIKWTEFVSIRDSERRKNEGN